MPDTSGGDRYGSFPVLPTTVFILQYMEEKYRLYHEVEVYKRFIYRGPKARGE